MSILLPKKDIKKISSKQEIESSLDSFPGIKISIQDSKMIWGKQYRLIQSKITNNNFDDLLFILKLLSSKETTLSFGAKKTYSHVVNPYYNFKIKYLYNIYRSEVIDFMWINSKYQSFV